MTFDRLNHFKSVVAHQFFVKPADRDYLVGRWLLLNGFPELFWHFSQAIEKYIKAGLVLNGKRVDSASHDLTKLYDAHLDCFGDIAFKQFVRPENLSCDIWQDTQVTKFLKYASFMGSPDSRYGLTSWWRQSDDLFKFDQLCRAFRRLTVGLDWLVGEDFPPVPEIKPYQNMNYRNALERVPEADPRGPIEGLDFPLVRSLVDRGDLLHAWNFSTKRCPADIFTPAPNLVAPELGPLENSYLHLFWQELNRKTDDQKLRTLDPVFREGMSWLIENIRLPKETKTAIREMLEVKRTES